MKLQEFMKSESKGEKVQYGEMMKDWMNDGNVIKVGEDTYIEQTTQWKKKFTKEELTKFFIKEYLD